jgi:hypothetical protein
MKEEEKIIKAKIAKINEQINQARTRTKALSDKLDEALAELQVLKEQSQKNTLQSK